MASTNTEWREVPSGGGLRRGLGSGHWFKGGLWTKSFPGSLFDHDMLILQDADGTFSVHADIECVGICPVPDLKGFATPKAAQDATDQRMCKPEIQK